VNVRPAVSTNVSPSSLVKNTSPLTATGDAENPSRRSEPSRPWKSTVPLFASYAVTMLCMSFTRYSTSPSRSGDGTNGEPRDTDQATCVAVTSPLPPGRIAIVGPARPDAQ